MIEKNHFIVLKECRFFLKIINLVNENVIFRKLKLNFKIPKWLFSFFYLNSLNSQLILCLLFCSKYDFDLSIVIWPLNISVALIQISLIYYCLLSNQNLILDLLDQLQPIINQSV